MIPLIDPYLIRYGYSFVAVRIAEAKEEIVDNHRYTHLALAVVESWYGPAYATTLRLVIEEPADEMARLRFPHPRWPATLPRQVGTELVLWFVPAPVELTDYGVCLNDANADNLAAREILTAELRASSVEDRRARYLAYLMSGQRVMRAFAIQALGQDDLGPDAEARVAGGIARELVRSNDLATLIGLASAAPKLPYQSTTPAGRTAIAHALLLGAGSTSKELRTACLDALAELDPVDIDALPSVRSPAAIDATDERILEENDETSRSRLEALRTKLTI